MATLDRILPTGAASVGLALPPRGFYLGAFVLRTGSAMEVILDRVVMREVRMPLRTPFLSSSGVEHIRRVVLLELFDADGATAWSECVGLETPSYLPDTVDTAWLALRKWVIPAVLGRRFGSPMEAAWIAGRGIRGHNPAIAAVEMGIWILFAEKGRLPLFSLLGGTRPRVEVGVSLGLQPSEAVLREQVQACIGEGYRRVKLKIQPGADMMFLAAARDELGLDGLLMADANSAYTLADLPTFRAMDELGLLMIEQPLEWDDLVRHAQLQRDIRTPICLDESLLRLSHVEAMVHLGAGRIVNLKPGRVGGFGEAIRIHDYCRAQGVPVWCGGMLETGIGRACNVALASLPHFNLPGDISPSKRYWEHDLVVPEWEMSADGYINVPDRPGLGVEVDHEDINRLTIRKEVFAAG